MTDHSTASVFRLLAANERERVVAALPSESNEKIALLLEALRIIDYWAVFQELLPTEKRPSYPDLHIIQSGWNQAAAYLLCPLKIAGAFPMIRSTEESRSFAMTMLHQLGRSILLYRAAAMIQFGFLSVEKTGRGFILRRSDSVSSQFLDIIEFNRLKDLESEIKRRGQERHGKWDLFKLERYDDVCNLPGNFMGYKQGLSIDQWKRADIDSLMAPLIHPWDSGRGIMLGYDAREDVDNHFFAQAIEFAADCRNEAGIHPKSRFGETTGSDVVAVGTFVISLHMKHVRFALIALKDHPEILIPQSLSIWEPIRDLTKSICDFTGWHETRVKKALDVITLRPSDTVFLKEHSMPFMPLLLSVDNGLIVRPVSSVSRNPFTTVSVLSEWRNPHARAKLGEHREEWMRFETYALFQGWRYLCIEGSIKIREDTRTVTDIDAAILDRTTGELALIQLKWQDYFTNDVKTLRSKTSNMVKELDEWAILVTDWLRKNDMKRLAMSLRLGKRDGVISKVLLFAISRSVGRPQGYGFSSRNEALALANWPQFTRVRFEVGPVANIFAKIHFRLKDEANQQVDCCPIPFEISANGHVIRFEDLWNSYDSQKLT